MLHVLVACPCCLFMLLVHAVCPCCMSMPHVHVARPYCLSLRHALTAYPCCMIMLLVTAAWPCYVLDACPSSISLQYVLALCPLGCSDFLFLKISMAVHPLEVSLGPHELKKMLKTMKFPQASLAEISVVFLYQSVYRSTSALNISE
jgi:hypothetical protein